MTKIKKKKDLEENWKILSSKLGGLKQENSCMVCGNAPTSNSERRLLLTLIWHKAESITKNREPSSPRL